MLLCFAADAARVLPSTAWRTHPGRRDDGAARWKRAAPQRLARRVDSHQRRGQAYYDAIDETAFFSRLDPRFTRHGRF